MNINVPTAKMMRIQMIRIAMGCRGATRSKRLLYSESQI